MSFAGNPSANNTGPVTIAPKRSIGPITADVTLDETHSDDLTITRQPVEQGASITDHAFKNPSQLGIRVGFSNSSLQANGDQTYVNQKYAQFLKLQTNRELLDVYTARRSYKNMLIGRLRVTTDAATENALFLSVELQQILLVTTQTVTLPPEVQKTPQKTGSVVNVGVKQAKPVTDPKTIGNPTQSTGSFLNVQVPFL